MVNNPAKDAYGNLINKLGSKADPIMATNLKPKMLFRDSDSKPFDDSNPNNQQNVVNELVGDYKSIFGTDGSDITDPKAWADTLYNIGRGTATGIKNIFDALSPLSWFT